MKKMMKTALLLTTAALAGLLAQGLPDAKSAETSKGRALVDVQCAGCHGLEQVTSHRDTKDGWEAVVDYMISRGMSVSEEEAKNMVDYLAEAFPRAAKGK